MGDLLNALQNIKDEDLEYLYSVIKFRCRKRLEDNNLCNRYLEKIKRQFDLTNTMLFILLNQVFSDKGENGIKKFAYLFAEVAKNHLTKFFSVANIGMPELVTNLTYFNFFALCGEVESEMKQDNELFITIKHCQFNSNKVFCLFTFEFFTEIFSLMYKNKIIKINKKSNLVNNTCSFVVSFKDFKHIKELHLE